MAEFFIDRPVFAWVLAIGVMLGGLLGIQSLSVSQYPEVAPTTVRINARYPGASAETVENSVTKLIEQNMTGLDNLDYVSSTSSSDGTAAINLSFNSDADPDIAQVQVQNKLQLVESRLPQPVQTQGVTVTKSNAGFLLVGALVSKDGSLSTNDLADLISSQMEDVLRRVEGVGDLRVFGSGYAMRIWLNPEKLAAHNLTPADVTSAIRVQNSQVSAGQIGALPSVNGNQLNVTVTAQSQLFTSEEFGAIILRTAVDGSVLRVSDVARIEIGAENYSTSSEYRGRPAAGFGVNLAAGANAIETSERVRAVVKKLQRSLPSTVEVKYPYDTTPFVRLSIEKVIHTLIEAVVLVFFVMYLFMQSWRATLIPLIAVPVVLLGTFGVLAVTGFSINMLTMFAMVLAIGLLVDDAIVVVENVERLMNEEGLSPRDATRKSMREISGALWGIALVLSAVFVPMAFFGGSVGVIYKQFSVTIVSAMLLSVLVALVLTPALCASLLKPVHQQPKGFFGWFNRVFQRATTGYQNGVAYMLKRLTVGLLIFGVLLIATAHLFRSLPNSFIPTEDQGVLMVQMQLPTGATEERTKAVMAQVRGYFEQHEADLIEHIFGVYGFSFGGTGQNMAIMFVGLTGFEQREGKEKSAQAIVSRASKALKDVRDARVAVLAPPSIRGLGTSGGFSMFLQDVAGGGRPALLEARDRLLDAAKLDAGLGSVRQNGQEDRPQLHLTINQEKATALGVSLSDINEILSIALAGTYVNDFIDRDKLKPVYVQGDAPYRMQPESVTYWGVRNTEGVLLPFSSFISSDWAFGSPILNRFNGLAAVNIHGSAAEGASSGDALNTMESIVSDLGGGYSAAWEGLSFQEKLAGNQAGALYAMSVLVVFLTLAALYESWVVPLAVILSVPIGVLGAVAAANLTGQANDVYFKVGLLTTVGLAAKNAILIVEFAKSLQEQGVELVEATLQAVRLRLRPIIMTSFAFIMGVMPLAIATGAGSAAQNAIGIGVMGGMIAATSLGIFFVPLFYVFVKRCAGFFSKNTASN